MTSLKAQTPPTLSSPSRNSHSHHLGLQSSAMAFSMYKLSIDFEAGSTSEAWYWSECDVWKEELPDFCTKFLWGLIFIMAAWVASLVAAISGCMQVCVNKSPDATRGAKSSIIS